MLGSRQHSKLLRRRARASPNYSTPALQSHAIGQGQRRPPLGDERQQSRSGPWRAILILDRRPRCSPASDSSSRPSIAWCEALTSSSSACGSLRSARLRPGGGARAVGTTAGLPARGTNTDAERRTRGPAAVTRPHAAAPRASESSSISTRSAPAGRHGRLDNTSPTGFRPADRGVAGVAGNDQRSARRAGLRPRHGAAWPPSPAPSAAGQTMRVDLAWWRRPETATRWGDRRPQVWRTPVSNACTPSFSRFGWDPPCRRARLHSYRWWKASTSACRASEVPARALSGGNMQKLDSRPRPGGWWQQEAPVFDRRQPADLGAGHRRRRRIHRKLLGGRRHGRSRCS